MASAQKELENFDACMGDADASWENFQYGIAEFENKDYVRGIKFLTGGVVSLAHAVQDCNVKEVSEVAENMFNKVNANTVANKIGEITQLLVEGADVTLDINRAVLDFTGKNWSGLPSVKRAGGVVEK